MNPLLLTPGPLTTSARTRAALDRDWGSRDRAFIAMSEAVRTRLAALAGVSATHVAVPIQGSGTTTVEAAVQTLVPRKSKLPVLVNSAYGRRIAEIARRAGRALAVLDAPEDEAIHPDAVAHALSTDPAVTDVALVHCETISGLLNPLKEIAAVVRAHGCRLLVDVMSSFGAVPRDGVRTPFAALVGSADKGLEGVPGLAFAIADAAHLAACEGNAASLTLDLYAQWRGFEANGQWRFTPPVQVVAALSAALDQLQEEGGIAARHMRYCRNCGMHARGVVIYPGKLTAVPSFRIGAIGEGDMRRALAAVGAFMAAHGPDQAFAASSAALAG